MASTLKQVRDLIVTETKIQGDKDFPDLLLNRIINDSYRYVQMRLFHLGWKELIDTDSLTLSSGTFGATSIKTSDLSTDCPNRMGVPDWLILIECADSGDPVAKGIARPVGITEFNELLINTYLLPTIIKPICTITDDKIYIAPSTVATATAHFYKEATDLSADGDTIAIPEAYVTFIIQRSMLEVEDMKGRLDKKQVAMAKLEAEIAKSFEAIAIQKSEVDESAVLQ